MPYPSDNEGLKGLARVTCRNTVLYEGTGETAPAPGASCAAATAANRANSAPRIDGAAWPRRTFR